MLIHKFYKSYILNYKKTKKKRKKNDATATETAADTPEEPSKGSTNLYYKITVKDNGGTYGIIRIFFQRHTANTESGT